MSFWIANTCEYLLLRWQAATLHDYGVLVLVTTVSGWLLTRERAV
jgi:hypothetical protein